MSIRVSPVLTAVIIGKREIMKEIRIMDGVPAPNQRMKMGAIATMGTDCKKIA